MPAMQSVFSPYQLPNRLLDLDAMDLGSLFLHANGAGPVTSDGDLVGSIKDSRLNGVIFNAPGDPQRPTYHTGILNGRPGLLFSGSQFLLSSNVHCPANHTIYIVYSGRSGTNGSLLGLDGDPTLYQRNTTIGYGSGKSYSLYDPLNNNTLLTIVHDYDNDVYYSRLNGVVQGSSVVANVPLSSTANFRLGYTNLGGEYLNGYLHQVIMYSGVHSVSTQIKISYWLKKKWGSAYSAVYGKTKILPYQLLNTPAIFIRFDDGFASTLTKARSLMYGMPATVYCTKNFIGTAGYLTADQMAELSSAGWDLGNHSVSHPQFHLLTQQQIQDELTGCQNWLEGLGLSRASWHVAYPSNDYGGSTIAAMGAAGMLSGSIESDLAQTLPIADLYQGIAAHPLGGYSVSDLIAWIGASNTANKLTGIMFHNIVDSVVDAGVDYATADFQAIFEAIYGLQMTPLTASQIYSLHSHPLEVALPW
jgi:hypothetical protein